MALAEALELLRADPKLKQGFVEWRELPPVPAAYADFSPGFNPRLKKALAEKGIERLYLHQSEALEAVRGRQNIVVVKHAGQKFGLVVDALMGEAQTVIKPLSKVFSQAKSDILLVDPYMDDSVLLEFGGAVPETVTLRLLSDQATAKQSLEPAARKWKSQYPPAAYSSLISVSYQYLRHAGKRCRNKSGCRSVKARSRK